MEFSDGSQFVLRGTAEMERQLMTVRGRGERSEAELDRLAAKLRNEADIVLTLDPETARRTGGDLLTSNHPLVRAALGVPGHVQSRFAGIRIPEEQGDRSFLVLLAVASWEGVRRSVELWAVAVPLDGGEPTADIGDHLMAGLAEGSLEDGPVPSDHGLLLEGLERAERELLDRWEYESERRVAENRALVEVRRISLEETFRKKVDRIERTIRTLRERDRENMIGLQQAQLRTQERELRRKSVELDGRIQGSLSVERIAACVVTRGNGHD